MQVVALVPKAVDISGGTRREAFEQLSLAGLQVPALVTPSWPAPHTLGAPDPHTARSFVALPALPLELLDCASRLAIAMKLQWQEVKHAKRSMGLQKVASLRQVQEFLTQFEEDKAGLRHLSAPPIPEALRPNGNRGSDHYGAQRHAQLLKQARRLAASGIESDSLEWLVQEREHSGSLMRIDQGQTTLPRFRANLVRAAAQLGMREIEAQPGFEELLALTALFCTQSSRNAQGFLTRFPEGLFEREPHALFERRARVILRGCFSELGTARAIETVSSIRTALDQANLTGLVRGLNVRDVVELAYPGITLASQGHFWDPCVRPWLLEYPGKGSDRSLVNQASAFVLLGDRWQGEAPVAWLQAGLLRVDHELMQQLSWGKRAERAGVRKLMETSPWIPNTIELLRVGASALGKHDLIGFGDGQVPLTAIDSNRKWRGKLGFKYLDEVTHEVTRRARISNPELFTADGADLLPQQVRSFGAWSALYNQVACDCLRGTDVTILEALSRVHKDLGGWQRQQLKEWEMGWTGKWQGRWGEARFLSALAYTLWSNGLGVLAVEEGELRYSARQSEWRQWATQQGRGPLLNEILTEAGLSFPFKRFAASNAKQALSMLFGHSLEEVLESTPQASRAQPSVAAFGERLFGIYGEQLQLRVARLDADQLDRYRQTAARTLLQPYANPFFLGSAFFASTQMLEQSAELLQHVGSRGLNLIPLSIRETGLADAVLKPEVRGHAALQRFSFAQWYGDLPCSLPFRTLKKLLGAESCTEHGQISAWLSAEPLRDFMHLLKDQAIENSSVLPPYRAELRQTIEDFVCFVPDIRSILQAAVTQASLLESAARTTNKPYYTRLHVLDALAAMVIEGKVDSFG
jgi:hypothetical protein